VNAFERIKPISGFDFTLISQEKLHWVSVQWLNVNALERIKPGNE